MFTRLARVFRLSTGGNNDEEASSDEEFEGTCVDMGSAYIRPSKKTQEVEGVVTNMYSTYGLINGEIVFTRENFAGSEMPLVGDRVDVRAYKEHSSAGWLAERVTKVANCWDDSSEWTSEDESQKFKNELDGKKQEEDAKKKKRRERRLAEREALELLLKEKFGVEIIGTDFGIMEVGEKKSLSLEIKNNGTDCQSLCNYKMNNKSQQIDFGPLKMIGIDTKCESKKYQEMFPIDILPGQSVSITLICLAKYIGSETQTIIFYFEKFKLGKLVSVSVSDPSMKFVGTSSDNNNNNNTYQRIDKLERVMLSREQALKRDSVLVPGPRPQFSKGRAKPKGAIVRLPHYHVPDDLRDCVLNGRDVTRFLPCLKRSLNSSTYEIWFSGLLFLEEIQQEIDIREFDMDKTTMEVVGEYISLKVPGLVEGRPSLILGDKVVASEVELLNTAAPIYEGIVHQVRNDSVFLMFGPEFHKSFNPDTQYNIVFTFNRSTLRRCHMAVELASKFKDEILFPTKITLKPSQVDLLHTTSAQSSSSTNRRADVVPVSSSIGRKHSSYYPNIQCDQSVKFFNSQLNNRQKLAVIRILQGQARPTPYIIFGPPGTGKTITVVESILQLQHHLPHARILACTPSNSAADLLAERLFLSGVVHKSSMLRLYAALRPDVSIPDSIKSFSCFIDDVDLNLDEKSIVICTCATAGCLYRVGWKASGKNRNKNNNNNNVSFTHVFIDEAGQATEPESMIAVGLVVSVHGQIILAGDPQQLGPVLRSQLAKDYGLNLSYMERLSDLPLYQRNNNKFGNRGGYDPLLTTKLLDNYRSHPALMYLPSHMFYHGELVIKAEKQLMDCLCNWSMLPNKNNFPLMFHGVRGEDLREGNSPSWFNPHEVALTIKYLSCLLTNESYTISPDDIGIITPYKKQVEKIKQTAALHDLPRVKVGSVEEFQGQERLAIIISTVRSSESLLDLDLKYTLGFLGNRKRFNVAITRAHSLLVIIGNPHVLGQDLCWSRLIRHCVNNEAYIGCDLPQFSHDDDEFFHNPDAPHTVPHVYSPDVSVADVVAPGAEVVDINDKIDNNNGIISSGDGVVTVNNRLITDECRNVKGGDSGDVDNSSGIGGGGFSCKAIGRLSISEEVFKESKVAEKFAVNDGDGDDEEEDDGDDGDASGGVGGDNVRSTIHVNHENINSKINNDNYKKDNKNNSDNDNNNNNNNDDDNGDEDAMIKDVLSNLIGDDVAAGNPMHSSPFVLPTAATTSFNNVDNNVGKAVASTGSATTPSNVDNVEVLRKFSSSTSEISNVSVQDLLNKGMIDSSNDSLEINEETYRKIVKQVDYYFSDVNLRRDQFLQNQIASDPDGWVNLSVLMTFNRMKMLNVNSRFVANVLKRYSIIVEVSEDGEKLRRDPKNALEPDIDKWKQQLFQRGIALLNYPISEKLDAMQKYFEMYGSITHIERGIPMKLMTGPKKRYNFKMADLIIYDKDDSTRDLFKRSLTQLKSMGVQVFYFDDAIKGCIDYFVSRRVHKQPRQSIEYVTVNDNKTSKTRQHYHTQVQNRPRPPPPPPPTKSRPDYAFDRREDPQTFRRSSDKLQQQQQHPQQQHPQQQQQHPQQQQQHLQHQQQYPSQNHTSASSRAEAHLSYDRNIPGGSNSSNIYPSPIASSTMATSPMSTETFETASNIFSPSNISSINNTSVQQGNNFLPSASDISRSECITRNVIDGNDGDDEEEEEYDDDADVIIVDNNCDDDDEEEEEDDTNSIFSALSLLQTPSINCQVDSSVANDDDDDDSPAVAATAANNNNKDNKSNVKSNDDDGVVHDDNNDDDDDDDDAILLSDKCSDDDDEEEYDDDNNHRRYDDSDHDSQRNEDPTFENWT